MAEKACRSLTQDEIEFQRMESKIRSELHRNTELAYARKEGFGEGEDQLNRLYAQLIDQNQMDDMKHAMSDPEYRRAIYREFGLNVKDGSSISEKNAASSQLETQDGESHPAVLIGFGLLQDFLYFSSNLCYSGRRIVFETKLYLNIWNISFIGVLRAASGIAERH